MGLTKESIEKILADQDKLRQVALSGFAAVDTDKSGFLEKNEVELLLTNIAADFGVPGPSKDEVDGALKDLDDNGDGKLSLEEFQVFIQSVLKALLKRF